MAVLDCEPLTGKWPLPPSNTMAMSTFHSSDTDIRWDDPSIISTGPDSAVDTSVAAVSVILIAGVPTIAAAASGSFIVVQAPIPVGEYVEVDGIVLTSVHGVPAADEFDGSSLNVNTLAANITAAINNGSLGGWGVVSATTAASSVQITSSQEGDRGNSITISSSTDRIIPSNTTLSGGSDQAYLTIGGRTLWAASARTIGGMDFDVADAGASITAALNDAENGFSYISARWDMTCIKITATTSGVQGNGIELDTNSSAISLTSTTTYGGTGTPCPPGQSNARWNIVGVNIYRSDTGERGPYFRVNSVPVGGLFYRDRTDIGEVPNEIIPWTGGWIFKGDSPNNKGWRLKTRYSPIVKRTGNAIPANSEFDVEVYIDGSRAPVRAVFGPTGEVDLSTEKVWNPVTESFDDPILPEETSEVVIRYNYLRTQRLVNSLDNRYKVFYRVTSVALDPIGDSPTGLIETPLGFCPPVSPMNSEQLDYIWRESIRRNRWILEQGGERVKLFIRRMNGVICPCSWDARLFEYTKQPLNNCVKCYGTGWYGGYEGPYDVIVGPDDSERRVTQTATGRRLEHTYEVWFGPSPMTSQRDFLVKQNGERYSIGPVRRTQVRGLVLQQTFQIGYLDSQDIRYKVPMSALERLPWPQTRFTNPELSVCVPSDPYPVGSDYQATPMATEKGSIPDSREQRGRTPIWQQLTYGGKGGR